jgi:hypothetical protein
MSRKKLRDLMVVFFAGLFVMTFEPVFLWLMIGGLILMQTDSSKKEKIKSEPITHLIGRDARSHGLEMPRTPQVRGLLIRLYRKLEKSSNQYPQFKDEYQGIVDEMWNTLAENQNRDYWVDVISSVLSSWPDSRKSGIESVKAQISRVNEMTSQWDEAQREVGGGLHV